MKKIQSLWNQLTGTESLPPPITGKSGLPQMCQLNPPPGMGHGLSTHLPWGDKFTIPQADTFMAGESTNWEEGSSGWIATFFKAGQIHFY